MINIDNAKLEAFVKESNLIEGIEETTSEHIQAHLQFLHQKDLDTGNLVDLVKVLQPDAQLRATSTIPGVRVGLHIAPPSGPYIVKSIEDLLDQITGRKAEPSHMSVMRRHMRYMHIHPFTDGNGRSGRALWLWEMVRRGYRMNHGFLQRYYYDTLAAYDFGHI